MANNIQNALYYSIRLYCMNNVIYLNTLYQIYQKLIGVISPCPNCTFDEAFLVS